MLTELSNSDLRAIANARATHKFFSRKISLYMILTGLMVIATGFLLDAGYLSFVYLFVWGATYIYITSRVSDKIYRKLLEMRSIEDFISTTDLI